MAERMRDRIAATYQRLHGGLFGLWWIGTLIDLFSIAVGVSFIFDGTGTTSSPSFDPARHALGWFGVNPASAMNTWGLVFMATGAVAVTGSMTHRLTSRGNRQVALTALWMMWAMFFASYAVDHHGTGLIGAQVWGLVAVCSLVVTISNYVHGRD